MPTPRCVNYIDAVMYRLGINAAYHDPDGTLWINAHKVFPIRRTGCILPRTGGSTMTSSSRKAWVSFLCVALASALQSGCGKAGPSNSEAAHAQKPEPTKNEMIELGRQHKTAADLFRTLRVQANGGHQLTASTIPDWTGVYTRTPVPGFAFDPDQPANGSPTAKLTPEFQAKFTKRMEDLKKGIEWDPIS